MKMISVVDAGMRCGDEGRTNGYVQFYYYPKHVGEKIKYMVSMAKIGRDLSY